MRLVGVARVVRAVLRRWVGVCLDVEDVQFGLRSGALELVNVELSSAPFAAILQRLGLSGARIVSVRADRIAVSMPMSWRRGPRAKIRVEGAHLIIDTSKNEMQTAVVTAEEKASGTDKAEQITARVEALLSEVPEQTGAPPQRYWRRIVRRLAENVELEIHTATVRLDLPYDANSMQAEFMTLRLSEATQGIHGSQDRWTKELNIEELAIRAGSEVFIQPCTLHGVARVSTRHDGSAALDTCLEADALFDNSVFSAQHLASALSALLSKESTTTKQEITKRRRSDQEEEGARRLRLLALRPMQIEGCWRYCFALARPLSRTASRLLTKAGLEASRRYLSLYESIEDPPTTNASNGGSGSRLLFVRRPSASTTTLQTLEALFDVEGCARMRQRAVMRRRKPSARLESAPTLINDDDGKREAVAAAPLARLRLALRVRLGILIKDIHGDTCRVESLVCLRCLSDVSDDDTRLNLTANIDARRVAIFDLSSEATSQARYAVSPAPAAEENISFFSAAQNDEAEDNDWTDFAFCHLFSMQQLNFFQDFSDRHGVRVCTIPRVLLHCKATADELLAVGMHLFELNVIADWPLLARTRVAAMSLLSTINTSQEMKTTVTSASQQQKQEQLFRFANLNGVVMIHTARLVFPYDWNSDRGALVATYDLARLQYPATKPVTPEGNGIFFTSPAANPVSLSKLPEDFPVLVDVDFQATDFIIDEVPPKVADDTRPIIKRASATGGVSISYLAASEGRKATSVRRLAIDVCVANELVDVVSSGRRLARLLAVLDTYLKPPPLPNTSTPMYTKRKNGMLIDVRVEVPQGRVVVLPPGPGRSRFFPKAPPVPGELIVTLTDLVVYSRQREEPRPLYRRGFRAQNYEFKNAIVELVEPNDGTLLARLVEKCIRGGSFEYGVTWPPKRPTIEARSTSVIENSTSSVPRTLSSDASIKRLSVHGPRARCALVELIRALNTVVSLLDGFVPSTRWDDDDPTSPFIRRRYSALFLTAFKRLEYVVTDFDVVLVSRNNRRPLARLRGGHARYLNDSDRASFLERFGRVASLRVDTYRVATACWEPLLEPGAIVEIRTAKNVVSGDEKGKLDSTANLDLILSRDTAAAVRALLIDALEVVSDTNAAKTTKSATKRRKQSETADSSEKTQVRATIKNTTGCAVWLELFDADGDAISFIHVPAGANALALPDGACHALFVAAADAPGATTIWRASTPLPLRRAASVLVPTLKTDFLLDNRRQAQDSFEYVDDAIPPTDAGSSSWWPDHDELLTRLSESLSGSTAAGLMGSFFEQSEESTSQRNTVNTTRRLSEDASSSAEETSGSARPTMRSHRRLSARVKLNQHARAAKNDLLKTDDAISSVPIVWTSTFDDTGILRVECRAALQARNEAGADIPMSANTVDSRTITIRAKRGTPDAPTLSPLPLTFAAAVFDQGVDRVRGLAVGDSATGDDCTRLYIDQKLTSEWQRANISSTGRVRARLEDDDTFLGSSGNGPRHGQDRPLVVAIGAEIVFRNALPIPVEFCVLAVCEPQSPRAELDVRANQDDTDDNESSSVKRTKPSPRSRRKRRQSIVSVSSRHARPERVVVFRGAVEPGASAAIIEADVTDYVWLATRCRVPASFRRQSAWAIAKLNAKSWRRRVAAARTLRQTAPVRTKHVDADAKFCFALDIDARDELPARVPARVKRTRTNSSHLLGTAPVYVLDVTARAPCVVVDRTGLNLIVARSRNELTGQRRNSIATPVARPDEDKRNNNHRNNAQAWCEARASTLSTAPDSYRVVPSSLRRFRLHDTWFIAAFDCAATLTNTTPSKRWWQWLSVEERRNTRLHRKIQSDARRHASLAWDSSDNDAAFLRDPSTFVITTSGADASLTTKRGAPSWLLRLQPELDCFIVVAFDARADRRPIWLSDGGFSRRESASAGRYARISAVDATVPRYLPTLDTPTSSKRHHFDLYEKSCGSGEVLALGPLRSRGDPPPRDDIFMYAVFVLPKRKATHRQLPGPPLRLATFSDDDDGTLVAPDDFSEDEKEVDELLSPKEDLSKTTEASFHGSVLSNRDDDDDDSEEVMSDDYASAYDEAPSAMEDAEDDYDDDDDDDEFFECKEVEEEEIKPVRKTPPRKRNSEAGPQSRTIFDSANRSIQDFGHCGVDFMPGLSFVSPGDRLAVCALSSTKVNYRRRLDTLTSSSDEDEDTAQYMAVPTNVHEMRLAAAAASGEPYPFELVVKGGVAALCAVVSSTPTLGGRTSRLVTILPRYVVANASKTFALEFAQPTRYHFGGKTMSRRRVRKNAPSSSESENRLYQRNKSSPSSDYDLTVVPILRLEPGESRPLHWAASDLPRYVRIRSVSPRNRARDNDQDVTSKWSRGVLRLDDVGSQTIGLHPYRNDIKRSSENDFSDAYHKLVLPLEDATVLRAETRIRAGDGDDFSTLVTLGDTAVSRSLVSCSNETDVLVACWQLVSGTDQDDSQHMTPSSPRLFNQRTRSSPVIKNLDSTVSRGIVNNLSSDDVDHLGLAEKLSVETKGAHRWLVKPRSEHAMGWCYPTGQHRIAAIALANRSLKDAATLLAGPGGLALEDVAAKLAVDEIGARVTLPLVDHSGQVSDRPVVWTKDWGIEAFVDMRAGASVVRFVRRGMASFDDLLSRHFLAPSTPSTPSTSSPSLKTRETPKVRHGNAHEPITPSMEIPNTCSSSAEISTTHSLSEYVARCKTFSMSIILDDLDDASSGRNNMASEQYFPRARREALRVMAESGELVIRLAHSGDNSAELFRAGSTFDASVGDFKVESYARDRQFHVVVERDRGAEDKKMSDRSDIFVDMNHYYRRRKAHREVAAAHISIARQRDGNTEVWRYAGARVVPLAIAIDRPTLCALCATVDVILPPADRRKSTSLSGGVDALNSELDRHRCRRWARRIRQLALAPATPARATATVAKMTHQNSLGHKQSWLWNASSDEEDDIISTIATPPALRERQSYNNGAKLLSPTTHRRRRQRRKERRRMMRMRLEDAPSDDALFFSDDGEDETDDELADHEPLRRSNSNSARILPASNLFEAFVAEPRAYVDTIEIASLRLRVTLALATRSANDLARATLLRGGAFSSSGAALLEMAAPLASLSDTQFRMNEFVTRHALLTTSELKTAFIKHVRRQLIRNALATLGLSYATVTHPLDTTRPERQESEAYRRLRMKLYQGDECPEHLRGLATHPLAATEEWLENDDDLRRNEREKVSCWTVMLQRTARKQFNMRKPQIASTSSQALSERLEGVNVLLSADAAYFGERARRRSLPGRSDISPLLAATSVQTHEAIPVLQLPQSLHLQQSARQSLDFIRFPLSPLKPMRRRRALAALPDGGGIRRRLEPYSEVAAAAQALARAVFFHRAGDDQQEENSNFDDSSPLWQQLMGSGKSSNHRTFAEPSDDPDARDGETYVDNAVLADGGLVVLATRGIAVLNRKYRRLPWASSWKNLKVAKVDESTLLLTRQAPKESSTYINLHKVVRLDFATPTDAKQLREKLRLVGVSVETAHEPGPNSPENSDFEDYGLLDSERSQEQEENTKEEPAGDFRRFFRASSSRLSNRQKKNILPSWARDAVSTIVQNAQDGRASSRSSTCCNFCKGNKAANNEQVSMAYYL